MKRRSHHSTSDATPRPPRVDLYPSKIPESDEAVKNAAIFGGRTAQSARGPFEGDSGRSQSETCAGCIVSLTNPTSSASSTSRSVSSRSMAENASSVFLASYLLLKSAGR